MGDDRSAPAGLPHYYNLAPTAVEEEPPYIAVECCYLFDWDSFEDDDWKQLEAIYARLPGYVGSGLEWFGSDEANPPFLWASVEMCRLLQVYGVLRLEDWRAWDRTFRKLATGLPTRSLEP